MDGPISNDNDDTYPWYSHRNYYYGPQPRARPTSGSHHGSDAMYGSSYYDTVSSSSIYGAGDSYWSDGEGGTATPLSSAHSYYRYSGRHHPGRQSPSLYSESELSDTCTVWATDNGARSHHVSADDVVSRDSSPKMSTALPVPGPAEPQPRPDPGPRQHTYFVREEPRHRSRSWVRRRSSRSDSRPRDGERILLDPHRHRDDHHSRYHDHRHNHHHEHDCEHGRSHHAGRPHGSHGGAATQTPCGSPTWSRRKVFEEEELHYLNACRHRHCHCHRKGNMALRFAWWTLT